MGRPKIPIGQWGEITVRETDSGWHARTKFRDFDGMLREVSRSAPTRVKTEQALKRALRERATETLDEGTTVRDIARQWLADIVTADLSINTQRVYRQMVAKHLNDGAFADQALPELTVAKCSAFLRGVAVSSGDGAAKTVRSCLRGSLDLAVNHRLIPSNPVRALAPQKARRAAQGANPTRDTRRALTAQERAALLSYVDTSPVAVTYNLADLVHFLAGTGVRLGEACAITWKDLNLHAHTVFIGSTVVREPGVGMVVQPFTKTGNQRTLYLSTRLVERMSHIPRFTDIVFASPRLKLRDVSNTDHALKLLFVEAGFPWVTSHTFRKTVVTLMDDAGFTDREKANQLGQRSIGTMQAYYLDRRQPVPAVRDIL